MPQNEDEKTCSSYENELDQEKCLSCNDETNQDKLAENNNEVDASNLSFPQNGATTACYVTALILVAAAVLLYSSTSPAFMLLIVSIACVLVGVGKGVQVLYTALESIYKEIKQNKQ